MLPYAAPEAEIERGRQEGGGRMEEGQRAGSGLQRGQDRTSRESIRRSETKELVSIERIGAWETKRGAAASAGTSPPAVPPGATGG